jgi:hypothetical protein
MMAPTRTVYGSVLTNPPNVVLLEPCPMPSLREGSAAVVGGAGVAATGGVGFVAIDILSKASATFQNANEWMRLLALVASVAIVLIGLAIVAVGLALAILRELSSPPLAVLTNMTETTAGLVIQTGVALVAIGVISMALVVLAA